MKNPRSYIAIIALMLSILSGAAQEMRDGSYRFIGKIDADGTVRNESYMMIGRFRKDGTTRTETTVWLARSTPTAPCATDNT